MKKLILLLFLLLPAFAQAQILDVTQNGLKADLSGAWPDGVANATTTFSSGSYGFTAADIGKILSIITPGAGGTTYVSSIAAVVNPTTVTLSSAIGVIGSGLTFYTGTDNTATLNSLLTAGADLWFPAGNYLFAGIVKIAHNSIKLHGQGPNTSNLFYANGGSFPFIDIQSAQFTSIDDLTLWSVGNDWQGWMVTVRNAGAGDPAQTRFNRVGFAMTPWANGLLLDTALETYVINTRFSGGFNGIQGASASSYSNIFRMSGGQFTGQGNVAVRSGGDDWSFEAVTFEGRSDGRGAAFQGLSTVPISNLTFIGCWFGDATVAGRNWITAWGQGFTFISNTISGTSSDSAISLNAETGFTISSNFFAGFGYVINYSSPTVRGGVVSGNAYRGTTTFEGNTSNKDVNSVTLFSNSSL